MGSKHDSTSFFRGSDLTSTSGVLTDAEKKSNIRVQTRSPKSAASPRSTSPSSTIPPASSPGAAPLNAKQLSVREAMRWAWNEGYAKYAWGEDIFLPLSKHGGRWNGYNIGLSILDSLDTLFLLGMQEEYQRARDWCKNQLSFEVDVYVNLFETSIRALGGLLSIYALTGEKVFLDRADDLGERLTKAFTSSSLIPYSDVNLKTGEAKSPDFSAYSSTSEVSTIQLEFQYLSRLTGKDEYRQLVDKTSDALAALPKTDGLVPVLISPESGKFDTSSMITLGARGDSYYEYLLKQWLLGGKREDKHKERYLDAMKGVMNRLLKKSKGSRALVYIAELSPKGEVRKKMDHLVCFMPGLLALGHYHGLKEHGHLEAARELMYTCYQMYKATPSGLAPEIVYFDEGGKDMSIHPYDAFNLGRPETIESLFIMYRVTGDNKYRDWGWEIFESFEKYARVKSGGYCALNNLLEKEPQCRDTMESFFLAETLKYFFLLFSDDPTLIPLDQFVLNTEAHPLPISAKRGAV